MWQCNISVEFYVCIISISVLPFNDNRFKLYFSFFFSAYTRIEFVFICIYFCAIFCVLAIKCFFCSWESFFSKSYPSSALVHVLHIRVFFAFIVIFILIPFICRWFSSIFIHIISNIDTISANTIIFFLFAFINFFSVRHISHDTRIQSTHTSIILCKTFVLL